MRKEQKDSLGNKDVLRATLAPKASRIWFTPFLQHSDGTVGIVPLIVLHLCDLGDDIPCHWSPDAS